MKTRKIEKHKGVSVMQDNKEELRRRQAVLEVMKIAFKETPYNPQPTNQKRKEDKMRQAVAHIKQDVEKE